MTPHSRPPPDLGVNADYGRDQIILGLSGDIDLASAPRLAKRLGEVIERGYTNVSLDCSELSFIDAAGLGVIATAQEQVRRNGGAIHIASPSALLYRLFEITQLSSVLQIEGPAARGAHVENPQSPTRAQQNAAELTTRVVHMVDIVDDPLKVSEPDPLYVRFQAALSTREVIARAQGILMERSGMSADEAYAELRQYSEHTSMPLYTRAEEIVASSPHRPVPARIPSRAEAS
jgi:anti-sigma B factor antagonist